MQLQDLVENSEHDFKIWHLPNPEQIHNRRKQEKTKTITAYDNNRQQQTATATDSNKEPIMNRRQCIIVADMQKILGIPATAKKEEKKAKPIIHMGVDLEWIMHTFPLFSYMSTVSLLKMCATAPWVDCMLSRLKISKRIRMIYTTYAKSFTAMSMISKNNMAAIITDYSSRSRSTPVPMGQRLCYVRMGFRILPWLPTKERCMAATNKKGRCKNKGVRNAFGYLCGTHMAMKL